MFQGRCSSDEIINGCIRDNVHKPIIGGFANLVVKVCEYDDIEIWALLLSARSTEP